MSQGGPNFDPAVVAARERLRRGREKLREHHDRGAPGIQLCAQLTDVLDGVILDLYEVARSESDGIEKHIALVPNGGYGRRDVAPFSDVDLMLLYSSEAASEVQLFARRLSQMIYDSGLDLGFATRTTSQTCSSVLRDATIFTSLAESRFLSGSVELFSKFMKRFRHVSTRKRHALINAVEEARREERRQYGETAYLLRPNVKRSRGALRDLQMVRWIGFARYGEPELDGLVLAGALSREDRRTLQKAREFLLRLRNELHFHAGKSQDVLNRDEQMRLPALYKYEGSDGLHPVELFMRDYFDLTSQTRYAVKHFVTSAKKRATLATFFGPWFSHRMEGDFRVSPTQIAVVPQSLNKVKSDLDQVLRLMDLANLSNKFIEHNTWVAIRKEMMARRSFDVTPEVAQRFLSLISQPNRLGALLRRLHELRVLEKIIPAVSHARCLLQFNEYHKYTVDEHSIRAVEAATEFLHAPGAIGEAYRGMQNKRTLHLALLLHDLGKGFVEDHSDVGLRLAEETTRHLRIPEREAEVVKLLVHKHLFMAHLALRHDLNDESIVLQLAVVVGSPNVLQMLYILTCADLAAVGPGVLNDWKMELITDLYRRTWRHLTGESPPGVSNQRIDEQRSRLWRLIPEDEDSDWWSGQIAKMPASLLFGDEPQHIVDRFSQLRELDADQALAWGRYLPERKAVEYTICAQASLLAFHRVVGVLTSAGNQILSAEINLLDGGISMDQFYVHDLDHQGEPPGWRMEEIAEKLAKTLDDSDYQPPSFRRVWDTNLVATAGDHLPMPNRVVFDNNTSKGFTILSVFAYDRMGLLYSIARTLRDQALQVHVAKIGTYLDQVVDVFYVTNGQGKTLQDEQRLAEIRQSLMTAIEDSDK